MYHFWTNLFTSVTGFGIHRAFHKSDRRAHNNRHQLVHPRVMLLVSWLQENRIARHRMIRPSRGPMADFTRFVLRQTQQRRTQRTSVCDQWPVKRPGCLAPHFWAGFRFKTGLSRSCWYLHVSDRISHASPPISGEFECVWRELKRSKWASPQRFLFVKQTAKSRSEKKQYTSKQIKILPIENWASRKCWKVKPYRIAIYWGNEVITQ